MIRVSFTRSLERFVACPARDVSGRTVAEALGAVFATDSQLKTYVVDEQGVLRKHVAVFVDGRAVKDRLGLTDPVSDGSEIFVMQALSGG